MSLEDDIQKELDEVPVFSVQTQSEFSSRDNSAEFHFLSGRVLVPRDKSDNPLIMLVPLNR